MSTRGRRIKPVPVGPCEHTRCYAVVAADACGEEYQQALVCLRCGAVQGRDYHTGEPLPWVVQGDQPEKMPEGARFDIIAGPSTDHLKLHQANVRADLETILRRLDCDCETDLLVTAGRPKEAALRAAIEALFARLRGEHRVRLAAHLRTLDTMGGEVSR